MKKNYSSKLLVAAAFLASTINVADEKVPNRISAFDIDVSKVTRIKLAPGLVSVIEFKEPMSEVFVGNDTSVKAKISKTKPNLVAVSLAKAGVEPTNLIAFYSGEKKKVPVIFEVIPSYNTHQDYVKVVGTYGAPEVESTSRVLVYSSDDEKSSSDAKGRIK